MTAEGGCPTQRGSAGLSGPRLSKSQGLAALAAEVTRGIRIGGDKGFLPNNRIEQLPPAAVSRLTMRRVPRRVQSE
jgi:hypothetical protein